MPAKKKLLRKSTSKTKTTPVKKSKTVKKTAARKPAKAAALNLKKAFYNLNTAESYEHAVRNGEVMLTADGPLNAVTTPHTGRSPKDRFVVRESYSENDVHWGNVNVEVDEKVFDRLHQKMVAYLNKQPKLYVREVYACADPAYEMPVRFVSTSAWHMLFVKNMFRHKADMSSFDAEFTVLHAPEMQANPKTDGVRSGTFIVLNLAKKMVLIGGTRYAGELKKSIFSSLNYLLPKQGVLSMHCSANVGSDRRTALFFGLSGTGKTTLSADPNRALIGDDEHGWSENGVFNIEGGCYAKVIKLSQEAEPDIWAASHRYGTVLENVVLNPDRTLNLDSDEITENTRSAYPLNFNSNTDPDGMAGHPNHIVFLSADAWGVLPPISKLTPEQAMYYFLSGYTAKLAGTERGVTEPQATFSACFGEVFMVWDPTVYAEMLAKKMAEHNTQAWLVNTGWTGGPYGVGSRMKIGYTRAMVRAAVEGRLDGIGTQTDPIFGLAIPTSAPDVPSEVLNPRETWADKAAYDTQAAKLAAEFHKNFKRFEGSASAAIKGAGPISKG
ncbi:MAG: phosphoenolpyruvate carboxykinase (ATP) [Anaerolineales bacterium]|nr:phosphoenolpyruvate carboxykinase (ATP) [Anaerolineales bacterium]